MEPRHRSSAKYRQTLLSFGPRSSQPQDGRETVAHTELGTNTPPARPAPTLPTEIWDHILSPLETRALKTFRLVCREWSAIGTPRLYATLYLNDYETCWSGLIAIAGSPLACLVKRIVWNPLVLMDDCLDATVWKSCFPNLLQGLNHWELVCHYEAFVTVWKARRSFPRSSHWHCIHKALKALPSCREVVLSDGYDVETACSDSHARASLQGNSKLLYKPTTWSLSPWLWKTGEEHEAVLQNVSNVLSALTHLPAVTDVLLDFWDANWVKLPRPLAPSWKHSRSSWTGVKRLMLSLKCCALPWLDMLRPSTRVALQQLFATTRLFPDTQELTIESTCAEPCQVDLDFARGQHYYDDVVVQGDPQFYPQLMKAFADPGNSVSDLSKMHARHLDMLEPVYKSACVQFCPFPARRLPGLQTIRLSNLSIDARLLLIWMCSQQELPASHLDIHLQGTTIVHSIDPTFVLGALATLNTEVHWEEQTTFWYPRLKTSPSEALDDLPYVHIQYAPTYLGLVRKCVISGLDFNDPDGVHNGIPAQWAEIPRLQNPSMWQSEIVARPDNFDGLIREREPPDSQYYSSFNFTYQLRLHDENKFIWSWVVGANPLPPSSTQSEEMGQPIPLLRLWMYRDEPDFPDVWFAAGEREEAYALEEAEQLSNALTEGLEDIEKHQQQLLTVYENELLGLDKLDDVAAEPSSAQDSTFQSFASMGEHDPLASLPNGPTALATAQPGRGVLA